MLLSEMTEKQCNFWLVHMLMTFSIADVQKKLYHHCRDNKNKNNKTWFVKKFIICKTKWKQKMVLSKYIQNSINIVYALVRIVSNLHWNNFYLEIASTFNK